MPDIEAIAAEYRMAYLQLKHTEKKVEEMQATLERDHALALKRYEMARTAYLTLALGEDDEFLKAAEE